MLAVLLELVVHDGMDGSVVCHSRGADGYIRVLKGRKRGLAHLGSGDDVDALGPDRG